MNKKDALNKALEINTKLMFTLFQTLCRIPIDQRGEFSDVANTLTKLADEAIDLLNDSPLDNHLPEQPLRSPSAPLEAPRRQRKHPCLWCEKNLYDETVAFCSSCIRFKSKEEMLQYRDSHPEELDQEGRLMRFPDLEPRNRQSVL
jgi:hypothetical protein